MEISGKLTDDWKGIKEIALYGLGYVAGRFIDKILTDFDVLYIIDAKKKGTEYKDIPVVGYESVREKVEVKLVVMTSARVYSDIRKILEEDGLKEGKDFCRIEQFAVEWYWTNLNKINIIQANTAVTTRCTLNCEKCNMFMPYYSDAKKKNYSFGEMKDDLDILMSFVDYIFFYTFLGGEPFINKELKDIIAYASDAYAGKIGQLGVVTNGTVIPDEETLRLLKKYHVLVSISDYTAAVPYKNKFEELLGILEKYNIRCTINRMEEWRDFGFPEKPFYWKEEDAPRHMKNCSPLFHGVNDKKLYYCHVVWSAQKAGIYTVPEQDYIDLTRLKPEKEEDRKKVSSYCMGACERGFLDFCKVCGGCGEDNKRLIPVAAQKSR